MLLNAELFGEDVLDINRRGAIERNGGAEFRRHKRKPQTLCNPPTVRQPHQKSSPSVIKGRTWDQICKLGLTDAVDYSCVKSFQPPPPFADTGAVKAARSALSFDRAFASASIIHLSYLSPPPHPVTCGEEEEETAGMVVFAR